MDNYRANGKTVTPDDTVQNIFIVMFASMHGTSFIALQSLFSLLSTPNALTEIREEIETTVQRYAMTSYTFKDGLQVPAGTVVSFPNLRYNTDPSSTLLSEADTFDGKRWFSLTVSSALQSTTRFFSQLENGHNGLLSARPASKRSHLPPTAADLRTVSRQGDGSAGFRRRVDLRTVSPWPRGVTFRRARVMPTVRLPTTFDAALLVVVPAVAAVVFIVFVIAGFCFCGYRLSPRASISTKAAIRFSLPAWVFSALRRK
ncbi:hypothetical protein NUW58_g10522 [Xylaria curta]|uniref:Uncharacterized protein n=1 Tax=Xylaria curta TaxID=42375 RepID=A0ACC1MJQ8_9PEZI|nr:hypothetical protein NUW58_g10522 [Xylaria curta]